MAVTLPPLAPPTVPSPRPAPEEDAYASWYGRVLGWTVVGGPPAQLATGVRFDVLELPSDAGAALLRRPVATGPVALMGRRMRFLVAAGSAEELDGLLDWLEWGGVALDLAALGAGGRITAPVPPGHCVRDGSPRGPPCGYGPRAGVRGTSACPVRSRTGRRSRAGERRARSRAPGLRGGDGMPPRAAPAPYAPAERRGRASLAGRPGQSLTGQPRFS